MQTSSCLLAPDTQASGPHPSLKHMPNCHAYVAHYHCCSALELQTLHPAKLRQRLWWQVTPDQYLNTEPFMDEIVTRLEAKLAEAKL